MALASAGRSLFGRGSAAIAEPGIAARQRRSASASGLGAEGVMGVFAYPPEKVYSRHYPVVTDGAEGVSAR